MTISFLHGIRLVLKDESGTITKYHFDVANDGANVHSDSWQVTWKENCVEVVISGEEQNDNQYILYFNGKTDSISEYCSKSGYATSDCRERFPGMLQMKKGSGYVIILNRKTAQHDYMEDKPDEEKKKEHNY